MYHWAVKLLNSISLLDSVIPKPVFSFFIKLLKRARHYRISDYRFQSIPLLITVTSSVTDRPDETSIPNLNHCFWKFFTIASTVRIFLADGTCDANNESSILQSWHRRRMRLLFIHIMIYNPLVPRIAASPEIKFKLKKSLRPRTLQRFLPFFEKRFFEWEQYFRLVWYFMTALY